MLRSSMVVIKEIGLIRNFRASEMIQKNMLMEDRLRERVERIEAFLMVQLSTRNAEEPEIEMFFLQERYLEKNHEIDPTLKDRRSAHIHLASRASNGKFMPSSTHAGRTYARRQGVITW